MSRIDDSHQPFKRTRKLGPGPKKRVRAQTKTYTCVKVTPSKTHYIQKCTFLNADGKKKTVTIKQSKAAKAGYNQLYSKWHNRFAGKKRLPTYHCRKTKTVKCK